MTTLCRLATVTYLTATTMLTMDCMTDIDGHDNDNFRSMTITMTTMLTTYAILPEQFLLFPGEVSGAGILSGQRAPNYERRPHIHGARSGQYRSGTDIATTNKRPPWEPDMTQENTGLPYTAREYVQDVQLWVEATNIPIPQQGPTDGSGIGW